MHSESFALPPKKHDVQAAFFGSVKQIDALPREGLKPWASEVIAHVPLNDRDVDLGVVLVRQHDDGDERVGPEEVGTLLENRRINAHPQCDTPT